MPLKWSGRLLRWYRKHRRDLPWRRTTDPYKIWVSEIMLQQTTVEAVIPYYERFLKIFPTLQALASASEDDVLRHWSGLGYYSRARNLHKASRSIQKVPGTVEELMKLPGIGRYTAGAIASIAFQKRAPIVDGNVIRVLSRIFAIAQDPKSSEGQKIFWKRAEDVLPVKSPGDFNQALMELGAMVCSPERPACLICPLRADCAAHQSGRVSEFPRGAKKVKYRSVPMTAALIQQKGKVLVVRRTAKGALKGLWEFPMVEGDLKALSKNWPIEPLKVLPVVRHSVMDRRLEIQPVLCSLKKKLVRDGHRWIWPHELKEIPSSSMNFKLLRQLEGSNPTIMRKHGASSQNISVATLFPQGDRLFQP